jgi:antitoxin FitA
MPQILVRDLDTKVVDKLKKRAQREGRSLQSEVKMILEQAVNVPKVDMETARQLSRQFQEKFKGRPFPDTVSLIREDRDR